MVKRILQFKWWVNRIMGAGSLQYIPVVVFPPLSVCWYAPLVSQLCSCHSSKGPMKGAPYLLTPPPPTPVTFSVPSLPRQHGWPLSPCHYPGIMWPVTEVHASSSLPCGEGLNLEELAYSVRLCCSGKNPGKRSAWCSTNTKVASFKGAVHSNDKKT